MSDCSGLPYEIPFEALDGLRARMVLVQVPPGLRPYADVISGCVRERTGGEVLVQLDPVFGACDLAYPQAREILGADLIVHIGHTPYPPDISREPQIPVRPRVVFLPAYSRLEPSARMLDEAVLLLRERGATRAGVVGTVQHARSIPGVARALRERGIDAIVPRGMPPYFVDGQVIGCEYRLARRVAASVDAFVYVGGGVFHPLGLYLATLKPVVVVDPYQGRTYDLTPVGERTLRIRMYKVMRAMDAKRIAIIVGLKTGQYRPWLVDALAGLARKRGVETLLFASDRTTAEDLRSLPRVDAIVITSCPRLPIDDFQDFETPVLTPGEARMALTGRTDQYLFPW